MFSNLFKPKQTSTAGEMLFSKNISMSMDGKKTRRNCNVLVTGATQHYRNAHYVLPNLAQPTGSYVIMDDTDEELTIQDQTEQIFRDHGYNIQVFDINHPEKSLKYNPFKHLHEDAGILTMLDGMTQNFMKDSVVNTNIELIEARQSLLQAIAFYLYKECNLESHTFANILKVLEHADGNCENEDDTTVLDILMSDLQKKNPDHPAVKCYDSFREFRKTYPKDAKKVITDLLVNLQLFKLEPIKDLTSTNQLDLLSIGLKPTVLYIKYSSRNPAWSYPLIPVLLTQLFDTLYYTAEICYADGILPRHVRVFLNNFGAYGVIPDISRILATERKYNISCDILTDDLEAIQKAYPDDWRYIIGNCDTILYLADTKEAPEFIAKLVHSGAPKRLRAAKRSIKDSPAIIRKGAEHIAFITQLNALTQGDCAVILRGCVPLADKVLDAPSNYPECLT